MKMERILTPMALLAMVITLSAACGDSNEAQPAAPVLVDDEPPPPISAVSPVQPPSPVAAIPVAVEESPKPLPPYREVTIAWPGKIAKTTPFRDLKKGSPCTVLFHMAYGWKTQEDRDRYPEIVGFEKAVITCGRHELYDSTDSIIGTMDQDLELSESPDDDTNKSWKYTVDYKDVGERMGRAQAEVLSTSRTVLTHRGSGLGGGFVVNGSSIQDPYKVLIQLDEEFSQILAGDPLFFKGPVTFEAFNERGNITSSDREKLQVGDGCTLTTQLVQRTNKGGKCLAFLQCDKAPLVGNKKHFGKLVLKEFPQNAALFDCETDEERRPVSLSGFIFDKSGTKIEVSRESQSGTLNLTRTGGKDSGKIQIRIAQQAEAE